MLGRKQRLMGLRVKRDLYWTPHPFRVGRPDARYGCPLPILAHMLDHDLHPEGLRPCVTGTALSGIGAFKWI